MRANEIHERILKAIDEMDNCDGDMKLMVLKTREKIRAYRACVDLARVQIDHAVRTGRLRKGSDILPDIKIGEQA